MKTNVNSIFDLLTIKLLENTNKSLFAWTVEIFYDSHLVVIKGFNNYEKALDYMQKEYQNNMLYYAKEYNTDVATRVNIF